MTSVLQPGSGGKPDQRDLPAVIGFAAMRRAAEAEVGLRVCVGVLAKQFDAPDARRREPCAHIGFKVELVVPDASIEEETLIFRVRLAEAAEEALVDLVGGARDGG